MLWAAEGGSFSVAHLHMEGTSAMAVAIIPYLIPAMGLDAPNHSEVLPSRSKVGEIGGFHCVEEVSIIVAKKDQSTFSTRVDIESTRTCKHTFIKSERTASVTG